MRIRVGRRLVAISVVLLVVLGLAPTAALARPQAVEQVRIHLVALEDNGASGPRIGCGDSAIPVTVEIPTSPTTQAKIRQALGKLFAIDQRFYGQSGLYNALYRSDLVVDRVELQGSVAAVYLSGPLRVGGVCDEPRVTEQIERTIRQFPGITKAIVIYQGGPLFSPPGSISFPQTGHEVSAPFFPYWEVQGGLPVFGYPLTDQFAENGWRVQYFERQRFEHHPENAAPYNVLFGLIGSQTAQRQGLTGRPDFARQPQQTRAGCEYFVETGHYLCRSFRAYWHSHGLDFGESGFTARESLALFGFPISEEFEQRLEDGNTYTVQYFERARFEYHPQNNPPYDILLGRLAATLVP